MSNNVSITDADNAHDPTSVISNTIVMYLVAADRNNNQK